MLDTSEIGRIEIFNLVEVNKNLDRKISLAIKEILKILRLESASLQIFLVNSQQMRALNRRFRNKDRATTILSFEHVGPPNFFEGATDKKSIQLGELHLSLSYIIRNKGNILKLIIHGILHLIGHDHKQDKDAQKMNREENRIYKKVVGSGDFSDIGVV